MPRGKRRTGESCRLNSLLRGRASLETFFDEIERAFAPPSKWGRNLDALDDLLSEEFGGIPARSVVRWRNSKASRRALDGPLFQKRVRFFEAQAEDGVYSGDRIRLELE
ncbi:MAG: barstar family protein [Hyphomonadaceae bacterium]